MAGDQPRLAAAELTVRFGSTVALDRVDIELHDGEILALLGPSGCGKSTLLRAIAGLQPIDGGSVRVDGIDLCDVAPHRRGMGLMSQAHALFPHRTVAENIAFGLELRGDTVDDRAERVRTVLRTVGLDGYGDRSIDTLSGGESQRVALARTLAPDPIVVMLDEPMGSLDRLLRERLAVDIRTALKAEGVTALVVTHDQDEAFTIADRIAVMRDGRIERVDTPVALRHNPTSRFVAEFLGMDVVVDAVIDKRGCFEIGSVSVRRAEWPQGAAEVVVPPEAVTVTRADGAGAAGRTTGTPRFRGDHFVTDVAVGDVVITAHLLDPLPTHSGVNVSIDESRLARLAD